MLMRSYQKMDAPRISIIDFPSLDSSTWFLCSQQKTCWKLLVGLWVFNKFGDFGTKKLRDHSPQCLFIFPFLSLWLGAIPISEKRSAQATRASLPGHNDPGSEDEEGQQNDDTSPSFSWRKKVEKKMEAYPIQNHKKDQEGGLILVNILTAKVSAKVTSIVLVQKRETKLLTAQEFAEATFQNIHSTRHHVVFNTWHPVIPSCFFHGSNVQQPNRNTSM